MKRVRDNSAARPGPPTWVRHVAFATWLLLCTPVLAGEASPPPAPPEGSFEAETSASADEESDAETETETETETDEDSTQDGDSRAPATFVASEQIRVDNAVPLPVDI